MFDAFVEASPVTVMMRGLMGHVFNSLRMNQIFSSYSERQYEQELLFSTQVDLMSLVVCGIYPSVHAAYQKKAVEVNVSATALYNKLQRVELPVSQALVHERSFNTFRPFKLNSFTHKVFRLQVFLTDQNFPVAIQRPTIDIQEFQYFEFFKRVHFTCFAMISPFSGILL